MSPQAALQSIVRPTLLYLHASFGILPSPEAEVMLIAIGLQESRFTYRRQIGGPARGYWQFERGGGVAGVMSHAASKRIAHTVLRAKAIPPSIASAYEALEEDDTLACAFARLLLLTDPKPLPEVHQINTAWNYYLRNWRPGKPHPQTWISFHQMAQQAVAGA